MTAARLRLRLVATAALLLVAAARALEVRVAFAGNSLLYFNDVPRLFATMHGRDGSSVVHDGCIRAGASLLELFEKGQHNPFREDKGAKTVADLLAERWDVLVLHDFTQGPARAASRAEAIAALTDIYAPLIASCGATPVLLQTHAYRDVTNGSGDLGSVAAFTARLRDGYAAYAAALAGSVRCVTMLCENCFVYITHCESQT